jgi:D-alanyl-lipoteichoic acid acyltransferase DltB (MBOAT superfamily)
MLFGSYAFIFAFFPIAAAGFFLLTRVPLKWRITWLILCSFVFLGWLDATLVAVLMVSIAFNFLCLSGILNYPNRPAVQSGLIVLGIGGNLSALCYYKYLFPFLMWLSEHGVAIAGHHGSVTLPLGISFFTFTQIGYLMDCKAGLFKRKNFLEYALFVSFFPHLIAGPIYSHREIVPQFEDSNKFRINAQNMAVGITIFAFGLFKKSILADGFIPATSQTFSNAAGLYFVEAWFGVLCYSMQLYFDFSGYSDMAVGLARIFGVTFPANFDSPYKSRSIIEFWQRWHISLTRYLTIYVYNPLTLWAVRHRQLRGFSVSRRAVATTSGFVSVVALPTVLTTTVAGVWHGAGTKFLAYGLIHGLFLCVNHAWRTFGPKSNRSSGNRCLTVAVLFAQTLATYLCVVSAFVFFRANSLDDALAILRHLWWVSGNGTGGAGGIIDRNSVRALAGAAIIVWCLPNTLQVLSNWSPTTTRIHEWKLPFLLSEPVSLRLARLTHWEPTFGWGVAAGLIFTIALLALNGVTEFIYFQF